MSRINSIMEEAAEIVLKSMQKDDTNTSEKVKAFDSLREYWSAMRKTAPKGNGLGSFGDIRDSIRGAEDAEPEAVHSS